MLHTIRRIAFAILLVMMVPRVAPAAELATAATRQAAQPQAPAQSEFVPVRDLPPQEQMPAAPLVIAAYAVAWIGIFIYLASIWRRLQKVDRELADVARRVAERSRT
jgi:CcmD family protein